MAIDFWIKQPREVWVQPYTQPMINDLLKRSHEYDILNKEPDCESEQKKATLKLLAATWGIKIEFPDESGKKE